MSHTEVCLQLKTGFLTLKDVMLTSLLKPVMKDLHPDCFCKFLVLSVIYTSGVGMAPLMLAFSGDALIFPGYKIPSK